MRPVTVITLWSIMFAAICGTAHSSAAVAASEISARDCIDSTISTVLHAENIVKRKEQRKKQNHDKDRLTGRKSISISHEPTTKQTQHSFGNSIYRHKVKIYIAGRQDWYSAYRRSRGPNGVMRKLVLDSNRRKKASVTFFPPHSTGADKGGKGADVIGLQGHSINVSNDGTDNYNDSPALHWLRNMRVRKGSDSRLSGSNTDPRRTGDNSDDDDDENQEQQGRSSIQAVRTHKVVGAPIPVIVRPSGLIPKAKSGGVDSLRRSVVKGRTRFLHGLLIFGFGTVVHFW
ncbi:hypothetical protein BG004_000130 [Podila humilis]|nr:hypothetical protein BG004_000130 [Podila humilis]